MIKKKLLRVKFFVPFVDHRGSRVRAYIVPIVDLTVRDVFIIPSTLVHRHLVVNAITFKPDMRISTVSRNIHCA